MLARLRKLCLGLPESVETVTFGHPTFQTGAGKNKKTFAVFEFYADHWTVAFNTDGFTQRELVAARPDRYFVTPYVGKHGWVSMIVDGRFSWTALERHVRASARLVAK